MKSNKFKIVILIFITLFLLFGGAIFYASSKLNSEEIKKIALEQITKQFPNSESSLGKIDIKMGLNFKIYLKDLKIRYKGNIGGAAQDLMSLDEIQVKIPFWAIITNGGIVEFKMDQPRINYFEFEESNNWTLAMGANAKKDDVQKVESQSANSNHTSLDFFKKSKVNIRLTNIDLIYSLKSKSNGKVNVSKFIINGLNFESQTAFEIASSIVTQNELKQANSLDLLVIGQMNLNEFIKNSKVPVDMVVKLNNIQQSGLKFKIPEIVTNINLVASAADGIDGKFETTFEAQNKIQGKFLLNKSIELNDLNVDIALKDVQTIIGVPSTIDMSKAKLKASGKLSVDESKKILADLIFEINPAIVTTMEGVSVLTRVNGEFRNNKYSVKAINETMGGTAQTNIDGEYDLNQKFDLATMSPISIKISARDIKLNEKLIRAKLWPAKDKKAVEKVDESTNTNESKPIAQTETKLPPVIMNIDWNNLNIGGADFSGKTLITTKLNTLLVDQLNFKFGKGSGKFNQKSVLNIKNSKTSFNLELSNLNIESFKAFFPPFIENFTGDFSGKINGEATLYKDLTPPLYNVKVDLNVKNGTIKKLNLSEYINPVMTGLPVVKNFYKGDKEFNLNGDFENLVLKGEFSDKNYLLQNFNFLGIGKKVEITGNGNVSPIATGNSNLEVQFTDHTGKISDVLQKNTGSKILPMKLLGFGFSLKPDIGYTVSKLSKGALKTKGEEKLKEVAGKALDKAADKLLNGKVNDVIKSDETKEKVNKLLKGLFK